MKIQKEKAIEIAQKQVSEGMKLIKVGNLEECWEGHENMKYYQENESLCIWRIDGAELVDAGEDQNWSKTKEVLTNEKNEFFYAVADYVEVD
jgi:hypothetical protein